MLRRVLPPQVAPTGAYLVRLLRTTRDTILVLQQAYPMTASRHYSESGAPFERHYRVLGISPNSTVAEIRHAYQRMVKETHPDHGGCPKQFAEVRQSYHALMQRGRNYTHFPSTFSDEALADERRRWDDAERKARAAAYFWVLRQCIIWCVGVTFFVFVVIQFRRELHSPTAVSPESASAPRRLTLYKERPYQTTTPEYEQWKAERTEEVERQVTAIRALQDKYKDHYTTYAARWKGQPYSYDERMREGQRRNTTALQQRSGLSQNEEKDSLVGGALEEVLEDEE